jgi:hypothetical protein
MALTFSPLGVEKNTLLYFAINLSQSQKEFIDNLQVIKKAILLNRLIKIEYSIPKIILKESFF